MAETRRNSHMKRPGRIFLAAALALGLSAGTVFLSGMPVYAAAADTNTDSTTKGVSAILCGDLGIASSVDSAQTLSSGATGTIQFTPVGIPSTSTDTEGNATTTYSYSGTLAGAYKTVTSADNDFYRVSVKNLYGVQLTVTVCGTDLNAVQTFTVDTASTGSSTIKLASNATYYIIVSCSNNSGTLDTGKALVTLEALTDNAGDSVPEATPMEVSTTYHGAFEIAGDTDCFSLVVPEEKSFYELTLWGVTANSADAVIKDINGEILESISVQKGDRSFVDIALEKGQTYYIVIGDDDSTEGEYNFRFDQLKDGVGDTQASAKSIKVDATAKSGKLQTSLDEDVFSFYTGQRTVLQVKVKNQSTDQEITAYVSDADGTIVSYETTEDPGHTIIFDLTELDKKSRYYIHVTGTGTAKYTVLVKTVTRSITYKLKGGKLPKGYIKKYTVSKKTTLPTPTKKGYVFKGWYTDSYYYGDRIKSISASETEPVTLYAKWAKVKKK
jgi:uncharacterized repeat protein (TIGR02543 family)